MTLLTPREVDRLLRYPRGRSIRQAKTGRLPCVHLPDGQIRFEELELKAALCAERTPVFRHAGKELSTTMPRLAFGLLLMVIRTLVGQVLKYWLDKSGR